jgi:hypothetical protein
MTAPHTDAPHSGLSTATTGRPVMLLTLDVPLDPRAQRFALETALGAGCPLVLCDAVPVGPNSAAAVLRMRGRPDADRSLRAAAGEARSLGVQVDELIFHSTRPLAAATTLCSERGIGLLVFGPSRAAAGRWRYRAWTRRVRRDTPCLVWLPED